MTLNQDIRWKQRFRNFDRAFGNNNKALGCRSWSATHRLLPATLRSRSNINFITVTAASLRYACGVKQSILPVFAKPNGLKQSSSNINKLYSAPLSRLQPFWIKAKDGDFFISDWLRNRNTVEFLGIWERIHNPAFNHGKFATIKSRAGLNSYKISVKEWVTKTSAIGLVAKAGRYGGTYAHKDIAFEFGMWISAEFKIYLIKEFQRLKDEEIQNRSLEWNLTRSLSKINYRIHTDAIAQNLIPKSLSNTQIGQIYANEADVLNVALYGHTAKQWREQNSDKSGNVRDFSAVEQLVVLSNLESLNAELIRQGMDQSNRLRILNQTAISQMQSLLASPALKKLK